MSKFWEFDAYVEGGDEDFSSYVERFNHYWKVTQIEDDSLKKSAFITALGKHPYKTLKDLLLPSSPEEKSFEDLVKVLKEHYAPGSQVIAERFKFNRRYQLETETVSTFAVQLRHLAAKCAFGNFLDDALRDRFVAGLRNPAIQAALLKKKELNFETACELARTTELAEKESRSFRPAEACASTEGSVNSIGKKRPPQHKPKVSPPSNFFTAGTCHRCGEKHDASECRYRKSRCHWCKNLGHLAKVCMKKRGKAVNVLEADSEHDQLQLFHVHGSKQTQRPYQVEVKIFDQPVSMHIDTGAAVSIINDQVFAKLPRQVKLEKCPLELKTYGGTLLETKGQANVVVEYEGQRKTLPVVVVPGLQPCLLGRDWLAKLKLNWAHIFSVETEQKVNYLLQKFRDVFSTEIGLIKGYQAQVVLKDGVQPVFCRARAVPYALKDPVELELRTLQERGVLEPVLQSDWATPLVTVQKADNMVRLCGDYKITLNPAIKTEHYPLPLVEDIFAVLVGGKFFTVLDLSTAYQQIQVHEDSQKLLTINTHLGLFKCLRMPYGISSAPAIFQSVMDEMLKGLNGVACYLDDVLIAGASIDECLNRVEAVLERFQRHGVRLKEQKCKFFQDSVRYLGHVVDSAGIHPCEEKIEAVKNAPAPTNQTELKAYLGMLTFYSKFIPQMSARLKPLYNLLQKNQPWHWSQTEEKCFQESKRWLTHESVLTFYDPSKPLGLVADASAYGVGAVLFHVVDGHEKPIAYASRTLSKAEIGYSHLEKEALAVVFGIKRFHKYIFGREFTIYSDHLPLKGLLGHDKPIPASAAARMQRWMLLLAAYRYTWQYRKGQSVANADALSRIPLKNARDASDYVQFFSAAQNLPLSADSIRKETQKDAALSKVLLYTRSGWPSKVTDEMLAPYFNRRHELSIEHDCVTWRNRVVVPCSLQGAVLRLLHEGHPGATRMKMLARSHVWWPGQTESIEQTVKECETCQLTQNAAPRLPITSWEWPTRRWQRIHLDFAYSNPNWLLVLVDAYSKWVDVVCMTVTTAAKTVEKLRTIFATFGLPEEVVTDNGPQFVSTEFTTFLSSNGIRHKKTPPYHPASNGTAERLVQTVKKDLQKQLQDEKTRGVQKTIQHRVDQFLFHYRNTPCAATSKTPAELFLSWTPRTRLTLLHPQLGDRPENERGGTEHPASRWREFNEGDRVRLKGTRPGDPAWLVGTIMRRVSAVTYAVNVNNEERYVHADHLVTATFPVPEPRVIRHPVPLPRRLPRQLPEQCPGETQPEPEPSPVPTPSGPPAEEHHEKMGQQREGSETILRPSTPSNSNAASPNVGGEQSLETRVPVSPTPLRRSTRPKRKPDRWGYE